MVGWLLSGTGNDYSYVWGRVGGSLGITVVIFLTITESQIWNNYVTIGDS